MTLDAFNQLTPPELYTTLQQCCGSHAWVEKMMADVPFQSKTTLLAAAEKHWAACTPADALEAFSHHPRIGERPHLHKEQASVADAGAAVLQALAMANELYEKHFGYIYIVCATGKTAEEMLMQLNARLEHSPEMEIQTAMAEQEKITAIRLEKLIV